MPACHMETEVYSRVVGYLRPTRNWNKGKAEEFKERVEFSESVSVAHNKNNGHGTASL